MCSIFVVHYSTTPAHIGSRTVTSTQSKPCTLYIPLYVIQTMHWFSFLHTSRVSCLHLCLLLMLQQSPELADALFCFAVLLLMLQQSPNKLAERLVMWVEGGPKSLQRLLDALMPHAFWCPSLNSTENWYPNNLLTHECWGVVKRR
jgi:hypothetical protein